MNAHLKSTAALAEEMLRKLDIHVTIGGEPTYVPFDPRGDEWHVSALGPTKLEYATAMAEALQTRVLPNAMPILTPGKLYPGEVDPRWVLQLLWLNSGRPIIRRPSHEHSIDIDDRVMRRIKRALGEKLKLENPRWLTLEDPTGHGRIVHILPLDHSGRTWVNARWKFGGDKSPPLLAANGPAGLRLPLQLLPEGTPKRALVLSVEDGVLHLFLPPLRQKPFLTLAKHVSAVLSENDIGNYRLEGYLPSDEGGIWNRLGLAADPGVLEVNLPPCDTWAEYSHWLEVLDECASIAGLRSYKQVTPDEAVGTGGGCHLLFGGESLDTNPFFQRPRIIASMCRYFQHHPSLAYLFTGKYVGASCQAPRPDETLTPLMDLEMAYTALESWKPGEDHRELIGETLRHLHADASGSSHRSEISFDKFWAPSVPGGCLGLVEFRAIEAFPHVRWNCAASALWLAILARVAKTPFKESLKKFGTDLHDRYLLPSQILADLNAVLADLATHGLAFEPDLFRELWEWRFPAIARHSTAGGTFEIRRALECWPLLSETPIVGGSTSRFVDTSIERIEFTATGAFSAAHRVYVNGRELPLQTLSAGHMGAGLRFRSSALFPSLHSGFAVQTPITISLVESDGEHAVAQWKITNGHQPAKPVSPPERITAKAPCMRPTDAVLTFDLRLKS